MLCRPPISSQAMIFSPTGRTRQRQASAPKTGVPFGEVQPPSVLAPMNGSSNRVPGRGTSVVGCAFQRSSSRARSASSRETHDDESLTQQYKAVIRALSPPGAIAADAAAAGHSNAGGSMNLGYSGPPRTLRKPRRGIPLVQWVWPSNTNAPTAMPSEAGLRKDGENTQFFQENPMQQRSRMNGMSKRSSAVVTGKVCQPVRPTRLDLSATQGISCVRACAATAATAVLICCVVEPSAAGTMIFDDSQNVECNQRKL